MSILTAPQNIIDSYLMNIIPNKYRFKKQPHNREEQIDSFEVVKEGVTNMFLKNDDQKKTRFSACKTLGKTRSRSVSPCRIMEMCKSTSALSGKIKIPPRSRSLSPLKNKTNSRTRGARLSKSSKKFRSRSPSRDKILEICRPRSGWLCKPSEIDPFSDNSGVIKTMEGIIDSVNQMTIASAKSGVEELEDMACNIDGVVTRPPSIYSDQAEDETYSDFDIDVVTDSEFEVEGVTNAKRCLVASNYDYQYVSPCKTVETDLNFGTDSDFDVEGVTNTTCASAGCCKPIGKELDEMPLTECTTNTHITDVSRIYIELLDRYHTQLVELYIRENGATKTERTLLLESFIEELNRFILRNIPSARNVPDIEPATNPDIKSNSKPDTKPDTKQDIKQDKPVGIEASTSYHTDDMAISVCQEAKHKMKEFEDLLEETKLKSTEVKEMFDTVNKQTIQVLASTSDLLSLNSVRTDNEDRLEKLKALFDTSCCTINPLEDNANAIKKVKDALNVIDKQVESNVNGGEKVNVPCGDGNNEVEIPNKVYNGDVKKVNSQVQDKLNNSKRQVECNVCAGDDKNNEVKQTNNEHNAAGINVVLSEINKLKGMICGNLKNQDVLSELGKLKSILHGHAEIKDISSAINDLKDMLCERDSLKMTVGHSLKDMARSDIKITHPPIASERAELKNTTRSGFNVAIQQVHEKAEVNVTTCDIEKTKSKSRSNDSKKPIQQVHEKAEVKVGIEETEIKSRSHDSMKSIQQVHEQAEVKVTTYGIEETESKYLSNDSVKSKAMKGDSEALDNLSCIADAVGQMAVEIGIKQSHDTARDIEVSKIKAEVGKAAVYRRKDKSDILKQKSEQKLINMMNTNEEEVDTTKPKMKNEQRLDTTIFTGESEVTRTVHANEKDVKNTIHKIRNKKRVDTPTYTNDQELDNMDHENNREEKITKPKITNKKNVNTSIHMNEQEVNKTKPTNNQEVNYTVPKNKEKLDNTVTKNEEEVAFESFEKYIMEKYNINSGHASLVESKPSSIVISNTESDKYGIKSLDKCTDVKQGNSFKKYTSQIPLESTETPHNFDTKKRLSGYTDRKNKVIRDVDNRQNKINQRSERGSSMLCNIDSEIFNEIVEQALKKTPDDTRWKSDNQRNIIQSKDKAFLNERFGGGF